MLEGLFQFLFKYRPLVFEQGDFVLGASRPMRLVILAAAVAAAYALFTYRRVGRTEPRDRLVLAGLPLAGLVMVTDGADTSDASLDESLASIKARSIPVFTVGVGAERFARDIQVTRVETPRTALKGTSLVVNVVVTQTGFGGSTVPIEVEDNGHIVSTQPVTMPPDGES